MDHREGHVFFGNLVAADTNFSKALMRTDQVKLLQGKLTKPQLAAMDGNVYVRPVTPTASPRTLIAWSPAEGDSNQFEFNDLAGLRAKLPQFEVHSLRLDLAPGEILQSPELRNYQPLRALPVQSALPADIVKLLGWPQKDTYLPGAYQTTSSVN